MASPGYRNLLKRITPLDRIALAIALLFLVVWIARIAGYSPPFAGFIEFCFFLSLGYLAYRMVVWARRRLLWGLRNRLIVAYVFIAVAPVVMLLAIGAITARMVYSQLAGYLLVQDIDRHMDVVADATESIASSLAATMPKSGAGSPGSATLSSDMQAYIAAVESDIPGLEINPNSAGRLLVAAAASQTSSPPSRENRFEGLVQNENKLWLVAEVRHGRAVVMGRAPVTPQMLESIAPYLGPIQLVMTHPASDSDTPTSILTAIGGTQYAAGRRIATTSRQLQPATSWFDNEITGVSTLDAELDSGGKILASPVFASYTARRSRLQVRFFASLGDLSSYYFELLVAIGLAFLVLEAAALVTGIVMTRTITRSVGDLYTATQYVKAGDFSHRIRVERPDQLGALADSFNGMAESVNTLVEEQRARQRLENEVSIAREVQSQLFPRKLPTLPGIELAATCRPARGVSGDYYDFIELGPTRLGIALADISGKGISAALLMASVQAALRSQLLLDPKAQESTAEIVGRVNRHLFYSTADDRFATFFFAIYDSSTRELRYTNAGHPAPICINGDKVLHLETGGTVVGVFDKFDYQEEIVRLDPGALLVVFSDGLVEPENVYGEEFGTRRLENVALRTRHESARVMTAALLTAAEEWAGTPEQADDMTVIVARLGSAQ
jgi:phosphoserine phosphatase RsbU/P